MTSPSLPSTSVETAESVVSGSRTAADVVDDALIRVAEADRELSAVVRTLTEQARAAAGRVDGLGDAARGTLPLAGVPVAVKGSVPLDDPGVRALVAAGAVPVAVTTTPEQCVWGTTDSGAYGVTRNPWDRTRSAGGSSGGSAALVASGAVPLAVGSDGMGSLRIPAAACGLVTIKPGRGVVPTAPGTDDWGGLSVQGPLATSVGDAALALSVMAGRPDLAKPGEVAGLRVGTSTTSPVRFAGRDLVRVRAPWATAVSVSSETLRDRGLDVVTVDLPVPDDPFLLLARWTSAVERAAAAENLPLSAMERRTRHHALLGRTAFRTGGAADGPDTRWNRATERFRAAVETTMDDAGLDVLLTPTLADVPPEATRWHERSWIRNLRSCLGYAPYCGQWNVLGWPAVSVPAGLTRGPSGRDLPTAVQLIGRPGSESALLAVARTLEIARPWPRVAGW